MAAWCAKAGISAFRARTAALAPRRGVWKKVSLHLTEDAVKPPVLTELAGTLGVDRNLLAVFLGRSAGRGMLIKGGPEPLLPPDRAPASRGDGATACRDIR